MNQGGWSGRLLGAAVPLTILVLCAGRLVGIVVADVVGRVAGRLAGDVAGRVAGLVAGAARSAPPPNQNGLLTWN